MDGVVLLYPKILYIFRVNSMRHTKWYHYLAKLMLGLGKGILFDILFIELLKKINLDIDTVF